jgi:type II secretory pathway pseudopilin PulG
MKIATVTLALGLGVLVLSPSAPQAASAEKQVRTSEASGIEVSAQRRYRRQQVRIHRPYHPAYRAYAYPVNDPSLGYFPTLRRLQREGRCVTDEGYGRFSFCDW